MTICFGAIGSGVVNVALGLSTGHPLVISCTIALGICSVFAGFVVMEWAGFGEPPPEAGNVVRFSWPRPYQKEHFHHGPAKERPSLSEPDLDDEHWVN